MARNQTYAVLTADIEGSRSIDDLPTVRDQKLLPVQKVHRARNLITSGYAVTAWDEFEALLTDLSNIPTVVLDLRRFFFPLRLRIAIGIGGVTNPTRKPINAFGGGAAFERARKAINQLNAERNTLARSTLVISGNDEFDSVLNALYQLQDALIERTSAKQWEAINIQLGSKSQDATAKRLGLDKSTVSRRLRRGSYWPLLSARDAATTLFSRYWKRT